MLADTADYLGQRRQFGAPIASFQALRHRLADMQLSMMQAQALTEAAVTAIDRDDPDQDMALATARLSVRDAARVVGEGSVQLHGAMGLTEELRLGARFKRLLVIAAGLGSEAGLIELLAETD
jgi:alkylation response protein AidB-like acyl-CoA dehydrogenase